MFNTQPLSRMFEELNRILHIKEVYCWLETSFFVDLIFYSSDLQLDA